MKRLDDALIIKFRDGDRLAFKEVYDKLFEGLLTFCVHLVPREEAKDITVETFFKLWKLRKQWNTYDNVRAFLYITARNSCLNYLNAHKTKTSKHIEIAADLSQEQRLIILAQIESEVLAKVREAVEHLPTYYQQILKLSYFEGYKNPEIAEKLGITEKTVRNAKSIALKMIKTQFFNLDAQLSYILILLIEAVSA